MPTSSKLIKLVAKFSEHLDANGKEMLLDALENARNSVDEKHIVEWLSEPEKWLRPRVSIDTFLDSPKYMGMLKDDGTSRVYPRVRQFCRDIVEGEYLEAVVVAGIGCEAVGTKILMADGTVRSNADIRVGDKLMGPDGSPRNVLDVHRGKALMYDILPVKGEKKTVTGFHTLNLYRTCKGIIKKGGSNGEPYMDRHAGECVNMTVDQWLCQRKKMKGILKFG